MSNTVTVGEIAKEEIVISEAMVRSFANLVNDHNPIHLDAEYASKTSFKKPIAHGMIVGGLFSSLIATKLPGPGSIYLSQNLKFKSPVFVGDLVIVRIEITSKHELKPIYFLKTTCKNAEGKTYVEGEAVVKWGTI